MGGELLDIDLGRRRETLRAQRDRKPERVAIAGREQPAARLRLRALFDVTSGGVFWIVAVGPARWAMRILLMAARLKRRQCFLSIII